jgi:hypothetical protein
MVSVLKKGAKKEYIEKLLKKISKEIRSKGVDTFEYCGKIKLNEDALVTQKNMRDEWG